jgi:hypothetical protein
MYSNLYWPNNVWHQNLYLSAERCLLINDYPSIGCASKRRMIYNISLMFYPKSILNLNATVCITWDLLWAPGPRPRSLRKGKNPSVIYTARAGHRSTIFSSEILEFSQNKAHWRSIGASEFYSGSSCGLSDWDYWRLHTNPHPLPPK